MTNKDITDKLYMLEPKDAPLYQVIQVVKKLEKEKGKNAEVWHDWLEDELYAMPIVLDTESPKKRICPYLFNCRVPNCELASLRETSIKRVRCPEYWKVGGEGDIDLTEVSDEESQGNTTNKGSGETIYGVE